MRQGRCGPSLLEVGDRLSEGGQLRDLGIEVFEFSSEERAHVLARGLSFVADVEDLHPVGNIAQRGTTDENEPESANNQV
jgi:hypothetical protein